jgi:SET domain
MPTTSRLLPLAIAAVLLFLAPQRVRAGSRDVTALSQWAERCGVRMHPNLHWKNNGEEDWGLELTSPVPRGTVLLTVPRSIVLDSSRIKKEILKEDPTKVETCVQALGPFQVHQDNFWIVIQLFRYRLNKGTNYWAPWLAAMPQRFPEFTKAEQECLPYYAKYAAEYQEQKFQAFCQAAAALGEIENSENAPEIADLKWAFQAVGSRFWKTASVEEQQDSHSELVPIGDMFNHRDPPNVQMVPHKEDQVTFVYLGEDESAGKDLFITYGHPSNPHRFLVIFGFVPTDMRHLWSHTIYSDSNPYSNDVTKMVFETADGTITQHVWDAVMFELLQPGVSPEQFLERKDHLPPKYKWYAADLLDDHITKQLDELANLRQKIGVTEGENMALVRQHNDFLTTVFGKVQANLKQIKQDLGDEAQ